MTGITQSLLVLVLAGACAFTANAQAPRSPESRLRPELRVDYLASPDAIHAGAGISLRQGNYLRLAAVLGGGPALRDGGGVAWRADAVGRFQFDPFRERRWGPYAGAGVSVRGAERETDGYLVALVGIEGRLRRGWAPAIEAGLGGGARIGLAMRRGGGRWR